MNTTLKATNLGKYKELTTKENHSTWINTLEKRKQKLLTIIRDQLKFADLISYS